MAEAIVIALVRKISDVIINQAVNYAGSLKSIPSQMSDIKRELELMHAFLRYADMHSDNQIHDTWACKIREVAFQIEDLVDEYTSVTAGLIAEGGGFRGFIHNTINGFKINKRLHDIANGLRDVDNSLSRLSAGRERYQTNILAGEASSSIAAQDISRQLAETAHFIKDDDIVGRDEDRERLADRLMDSKPPLSLIAVCGMGGVGKTMLVTNAYNSPKVIRHFILHAWIFVSQQCAVNDLLRRILRELHREKKEALPQNLDLMDYRALVETLHPILHRKRHLIILDDVWDKTLWTQIKHVLVDDGCRSRIVITTRNMEVAAVADGSDQLELKPFKEDDARHLFARIAFRKLPGGKCAPMLEALAHKIVNNCKGLPLALVCMGNLAAQCGQPELASLQDIHDRLANYLQGHHHLTTEEADDLGRVHAILDLSISYLPSYLRSCFLYCSVFPRGHAIKMKTLIRIWVSTGFIEERRGSTMEDVAEKYLNQLIGRCLFQDVARNSNAGVKSVKIHDLVHDVIVNKARKEAFFDAYEGRATIRQATQLVRHLSMIDVDNIQAIRNARLPKLRSFHVFSSSALMLSGFYFKWLRILNLEDAPLKRLPHDLVYLFNLCFLSIRGTKVRKLPRGLGNMRNLETLDAMHSRIRFIPKGVTRLENLRHLMASTFRGQKSGYLKMASPVTVPKGVCKLRNLQTLKCVFADKFVHNLASMTQIRTLHADVKTKIGCSKLCQSLSSMNNLVNLTICAYTRPRIHNRTAPSWSKSQTNTSNGIVFRRPIQAIRLGWHRIKVATRLPFLLVLDRMIPLEKLASPPPAGLRKLSLSGRLKNGNFPTWFNSLTNLTQLSLRSSRLQHESIIQLDMLPKLLKLQLIGAYDGGVLCIPPGWLPHLKLISLIEMNNLETIRIGDNALLSLESMHLSKCKKLKTLPAGIRNLTNLKELVLDDMPDELVVEIRYNRNQVQHIPCIERWYQKDGTWNQEDVSVKDYKVRIPEQSRVNSWFNMVQQVSELNKT